MRAAFESQDMGKVLKAYRNHRRHLHLLGKALNQEVLGRWLGLTQAQVSKFENGKPEQNLQTLRSYARILHMPPHMLWFDMPGQTRLAARQSPDLLANSARPVDAEPTNLYVLRAAELAQFASGAGTADPLVWASRLADARAHFERMYRNSGGVVAGARIEQFLARQALPFIAGTAGDADVACKRAIGGLIALAGVCAYDAEDWASANSKFAQALRIAEMSHDYGFHSYVLALMVNQALALEDYKSAERLADMALRSSAAGPVTPLTIDLEAMRIKALASMGDSSTAMAGVCKLEVVLSKLPAGSGIVEASYAQEGHLQAQLAEALTSLGDLGAAQRYGQQSLESEGHARGKVNRLASMATIEVAKGEIEHASLLVHEMIDSAQGMESRRLIRRFLKLRAALAGHAAAVSRDAIDRIDSAITLAP
ncbi:MAG TPA: helix-turn-helix transcriptional regulator [Pseudonocardiaceae bacterium]|nr:helix-turn-helix transcriptional regulator [Pseudonocardiaceae bacterium]